MRNYFYLFFACFLALAPSAFSDEKGLTVKGVRYFSYTDFTRIVFEVEAAAPYIVTKTADGQGLMLSAYDGPFILNSPLPAIRDGVVSGIDAKEDAGRVYVLIRLSAAPFEVKDFVLRGPDRLVLDLAKGKDVPVPAEPVEQQVVIVLDPGHGGRDTGIVTVRGQEKTINLDLARSVRKILQKDRRLKVVLTRDKDVTLSADERAAAANAAGPQVFVSLHSKPGNGVRVYVHDLEEDLITHAKRPLSRDFLGFETVTEQREKLWDRQQAAHAKEGGLLGRKLVQLLGEKDSEPVQAPVRVLKPVDAAGVMIEVGTEYGRQKTASAVAKGIELHVRENR